ncbi:family 78 glycoside hydrolase catalytic domain [Microbacterium sp.]|uniref:family 78 glycoside hydrolase catalytic domain n=1 Tax=Microbacterium sp. TaxID=51671 RepID=UPI003A941555
MIRDLRVEYLRAPGAIGTRVPRFSWLPDHEQTAYRLRVARGDDELWDTGRVTGSNTVLIEYAGAPLESDADYTWTVWSWDAAGAASSASHAFSTALLEAGDYRADWVTPVQRPTAVEEWTLLDWITGNGPKTPIDERLRPVQLLRQEFSLREAPVRARLYATARGVYTAWANGTRAGDEHLSPGFDAYAHRTCVQSFDVTTAVTAGVNVLGLALADGWWAGRIGITGSSAQWGDATSAWWQLHVAFADGRTQVITSGAGVRSSTGPWRHADLFVGEHYDARAEPEGWRLPGYDDTEWKPVAATDADLSMLVPFTGAPVRRVDTLHAVSLDSRKDGVIVDFGQVIAGRVRLRLRDTAPGQTVTIEHTELLAPDGSWFQNITGINKEQTDVYVAAGGEWEEWEPEFTFHGFRYARITGAQLGLDDIVAVVLASDLEPTGAFTTSDARVNRLHENAVWSQRGNFLSIPTDCPQRERAGWTGDIQVFAPAATNNAQVAPFLARWLANLRADQTPAGGIPIFSPRSPYDVRSAAQATGIGAVQFAAGWGDAIASVPWTLWQRYGDRRVLEENIDAICGWVAYQSTDAYLDGHHFGDWLAPSTLEQGPHHEAIGVAPALTGRLCAEMFRVRTLDVASRIAAVLGRDASAAEFAQAAASARHAFADAHIDPEGRLDVSLQGMYVLALAFDLVPEQLRQRTADHLVGLVHERGDRLDTGFLSVPYLLDVLWDTGHADLARRLLWQSEMPSWLYQVDHGATTIWEAWDAVVDGRAPRAVSLNHYAFGCVDDVLFRRIAGIRSAEPGYATVEIAPDLDCGLAHVDAHVDTVRGRVAVSWKKGEHGATVTVTLPPGVRGSLRVDGSVRPLSAGTSRYDVAPDIQREKAVGS